jgi:hypothetical protein
MILRRAVFVLLILSFTLVVSAAQGQDQEAPLVVLIEGRAINTSSVTNVGPAGASRLQEILISLGARINRITLTDDIPEDADLAVLLRPLRRLSPAQMARLWVHLYRGNNLLIAVDPDNANLGTANVSHRIDSSGMTVLLERAFGVTIGNTALVPEGATSATIAGLDTLYMPVFPDMVPHDVLAPLVDYRLPVWTWGSRHMDVEPFGINGIATPLLFTSRAYGESNPDIFPPFRNAQDFVPAPLALDSEEDVVGSLNVAALAENVVNGSRVLVLGDSEMLENGYGLRANGNVPRFVGNYVFAQRAIAWLLNIEPQEWLPLPEGMTWIAVDGSGAEWDSDLEAIPDQDGDTASGGTNIEQVRTFLDDQFLYLLVETSQPPSAEVSVEVQFDTDNDGQLDHTVSIQPDRTTVTTGEGQQIDVLDAMAAYGDTIEVRLPQRAIPPSQGIDSICLRPGDQEADCVIQPINIPASGTTALTEITRTDGLIATVQSNQRVNLRRTPDTEQPPLMTIANGSMFTALGRDESGEWVYVQNARHEGWLATFLLVANGDVMSLPVLETP